MPQYSQTRPQPVITVAGSVLDPGSVALPLEISHGRSGTSTQPDAPTASFTWLGETVPFGLGDPAQITLELPAGGTSATWGDPAVTWADLGYTWDGSALNVVPRFTGDVAALVAIESDGVVSGWEVGLVGTLAKLGTVPISYQAPAGQTDTERVQEIGRRAGYPITIVGPPAGLPLAADGIDRDALSALHEICSWTGGILFQGRDGEIYYGTSDHRATAAQSYLPAGAILDGVEWATTYGDVVNHVVVMFGDPQTQNTYRDDDSIEQWGFRHVEITTKLQNQSDADAFGNTVLLRRRQPFWTMPGVVTNSEDLTDAEYWESNLITFSSGVIVPVPVEPGPTGNVAVWTAEGWQEVWDTPYNQRFQFALSDRDRWGSYVLRRWDAVALETWDYWTAYSWLQQLADN